MEILKMICLIVWTIVGLVSIGLTCYSVAWMKKIYEPVFDKERNEWEEVE